MRRVLWLLVLWCLTAVPAAAQVVHADDAVIANTIIAGGGITGTILTGTSIVSSGAISGTTITGTSFVGPGTGLTSVPAAQVVGSHTLSDVVLSTNVPLLNSGNTFSIKQIVTVSGSGDETLTLNHVTGTHQVYMRINNAHDNLLIGMEDSTGNTIFSNNNFPYSAVIGTQQSAPLQIGINNGIRWSFFEDHVEPFGTSVYNLGSPGHLFNHIYGSTLDAILFAKSTQTIFGGSFAVSKDSGTFAVAVASGDTTIDFGTAMTLNDFVLVKASDTGGSVTLEYIKVGTNVSGTLYNVTRNLSGGGAKNWSKGTPFQVRGGTSDEWIEVTASASTARLSLFTQGSLYSNSVENLRIGELTGMPNSSSGIGAYIGDATSFFRYTAASGLKLLSSTLTIDTTGITVAPNSLATSTMNSYKFSRLSTGSFGQTGDVFGTSAWYDSAAGEHHLEFQNVLRGLGSGSGGLNGNATVLLHAQGWTSSFGGVPAGEALVTLVGGTGAGTSGITLSATDFVELSGNTTLVDFGGSTAGVRATVGGTALGLQLFQSGATNVNGLVMDIHRTDSATPTGEYRISGNSTSYFTVAANIVVGNKLEFNTQSVNMMWMDATNVGIDGGHDFLYPRYAAATGSRYVCIDTAGKMFTQAGSCPAGT